MTFSSAVVQNSFALVDAAIVHSLRHLIPAITVDPLHQGIPAVGKVQGWHAVSKLLVAQSSPSSPLLGMGVVRQAEVDQWLSFAETVVRPAVQSGDAGAQLAMAKTMNETLAKRTFLVEDQLTLADIIVAPHLYPYLVKLTRKRQVELCHVLRWYDLWQHTARGEQSPLALYEFDRSDEIKEVKQEIKQEKEIVEKQEKKEKSKKEKESKPVKPVEEEVPAVERLDLRVGLIVEVKRHPDADSLYVEQIDVGEAAPRTVVSGLVKYMPEEALLNRQVVLLCNLKPASMRGIKSEAMVLAASSADGSLVELLTPPSSSKPGDRVVVQGFGAKPDAVLQSKHKIWETVQPLLKTNENCVATWEGKPLIVGDAPVKVATIQGGGIK